MKKEAKHLYQKAIDSLTLSIELFNRPSDKGRTHSVLILMDHSFEMLLKASILEKNGKIFETGKSETIGMSSCIRKAFTDSKVKFLKEEETLVLQGLNGLRDAAQHYTLEVTEQYLYFQCQSGLTLFRDICKRVFNIDLKSKLPNRVLPLSTTPPMEISAFFINEVEEIRKLLKPNTRKIMDATERVRSLAIFENSVKGVETQPSKAELNEIIKKLKQNKPIHSIFPSVTSLNFTTNGYGPSLDLRISKSNDATPIILVPEGTPGAATVAIKRVNELDFYNLSITELSKKLNLTVNKLLCIVKEYGIQEDLDCFKIIKIGKSEHKRYSQKALKLITEKLPSIDINALLAKHKTRKKRK
jgi:hypothetical protein